MLWNDYNNSVTKELVFGNAPHVLFIEPFT